MGDCPGDESICTERGADTDRGVEISGGGDRGDMLNGTVRGDTVSMSTISVSSQWTAPERESLRLESAAGIEEGESDLCAMAGGRVDC